MSQEIKKSRLTPFYPSNYYYIAATGYQGKDIENVIVLEPNGIELALKYYANRYQADIQYLKNNISVKEFLSESFAPDMRGTTGSFRKVFILQQYTWGGRAEHAIPVVYIKEAGKQALLFANSLPSLYSEESAGIVEWARENPGLQVYMLEDDRLEILASDGVDAVLFAEEIIARKADEKGYRLEDLLSKLATRATVSSDSSVFYTLLPDELCKLGQVPVFVDKHSEKMGRRLYQGGTLEQILEPYSYKNTSVRKSEEKLEPQETRKDVLAYTIKRSRDLADLIEIQFYRDQLKKSQDLVWTDKIETEFIRKALAILGRQKVLDGRKSRLLDFATEFNLIKSGKASKYCPRFWNLGSSQLKAATVLSAVLILSGASCIYYAMTSAETGSSQKLFLGMGIALFSMGAISCIAARRGRPSVSDEDATEANISLSVFK